MRCRLRPSVFFRVLGVSLVLLLIGPTVAGLRAADGGWPNLCVDLMKQHGAYLAQDRIDLADKVSGRARAAGCYNHPADQQLCSLLSRQEQEFNLSGRADLVNIVRAQERSLLCISATMEHRKDSYANRNTPSGIG